MSYVPFVSWGVLVSLAGERRLRERTAECMRLVCPGFCGAGSMPEQASDHIWLHARTAYCIASPLLARWPDVRPNGTEVQP